MTCARRASPKSPSPETRSSFLMVGEKLCATPGSRCSLIVKQHEEEEKEEEEQKLLVHR